MARKSFVAMVAGTVIFFLCSVSSAVVPDKINYQGKLTTAQGGCLNDTVSMTFTIYSDDQGTVVDWTEDQDSVIVKEGIFNVLLGSVDSIPASVFDGSIKYLGVQVESDPEMMPLKPIVSVAYAYRAGTADGGGDCGWVDDGTVVRLETDTDSVGIGTTSPTEKLDVVGNLHASGTITSGSSITIDGANDRITATGGTIDFDNENLLTTGKATIGSGHTNTGDHAFVAGENNTASNTWATVGGGHYNTADGSQSTIGGGYGNTASGLQTTVAGGVANAVSGLRNTVGGGFKNVVEGDYSAIPGGYADTITATGDYSYLFGIESKLTEDSTFMVDMPHIRFGDETSGYEFPASDGSGGQVMATDGSGQLSWVDVSGGGGGWVDDGTVVRLETSGDSVGIGTVSPAEKLDVQGNIQASGTITSGSSITIDGTSDQITSSSGTIDFDDETLVTTGGATISAGTTHLKLNSDGISLDALYPPASWCILRAEREFYDVSDFRFGVKVGISNTGSGDLTGLFATARSLNTLDSGKATGVYGTGWSDAFWRYGVRGYAASHTADISTGNSVGLEGWGTYGATAYGVFGRATSAVVGYGVYGAAWNCTTNWAGYFAGDVNISGTLYGGKASSKIDHPLDPENKYLYHSFVESPDMMNVYNGNVILDANGEIRIELPDYFEVVNKDFRYQLTAIGAPGPNLYVAEEISGNSFKIAGGESGMKVSWQITGIRKDPFAQANRIQVEVDKPAEERGKYLHAEAYGLGEEYGIHYEEHKRMEEELQEREIRMMEQR